MRLIKYGEQSLKHKKVNNNMKSKFEDKLDIDSTIETTGKSDVGNIELVEIQPVNSVSAKADLEADYAFARNKLLYAFERIMEIVDDSTRLVHTDTNAFSINAASQIFKSLNDNSKELLNLHKLKNNILKTLSDETGDTKLNIVQSNISDILQGE